LPRIAGGKSASSGVAAARTPGARASLSRNSRWRVRYAACT